MLALQTVTVEGGKYEQVKARLDLVEAEAEFDSASSDSERTAALDRIDDARHRLVRWRNA